MKDPAQTQQLSHSEYQAWGLEEAYAHTSIICPNRWGWESISSAACMSFQIDKGQIEWHPFLSSKSEQNIFFSFYLREEAVKRKYSSNYFPKECTVAFNQQSATRGWLTSHHECYFFSLWRSSSSLCHCRSNAQEPRSHLWHTSWHVCSLWGSSESDGLPHP